MSIIELLQKIRVAPGLYLGEESITRLSSFLDGYTFSRYERGEGWDEWLRGFHGFIDKKYGNNKTIRWSTVILQKEKTEEASFRRFFDLLDEYLVGFQNSPEPDSDSKSVGFQNSSKPDSDHILDESRRKKDNVWRV